MANWFQRLWRRSPATLSSVSQPDAPPANHTPLPPAESSAPPIAIPPATAQFPSAAVAPSLPPAAEYQPLDTAGLARIAEEQAQDRREFGEELRGVDRLQSGSTTKVERLRRFGLPVFHSESELARWLGISLRRLRWYTYDNPADTSWHYIRTTIKKRSGGERVILAPKRELKALQRQVLAGIVAHVPVAPTTHGFVPGRSTVTNAQAHVGQAVVLKLDLKDFFPSITFPRVRGLFISLGYSFAVASALALLCTEYDREVFEHRGQRYFVSIGPRHLVQGAPTSPGLANLVAWKLDRRLAGLAAKRGFTYTRYADDLTFSGPDPQRVDALRRVVMAIVEDEHFTINLPKTKIARRSSRQMVTGLVVNQAVATPRTLRRQLRAILHNAQQTGLAAQNRDQRPNYVAYLRGMIAYIQGAQPAQAVPLQRALERVTAKE